MTLTHFDAEGRAHMVDVSDKPAWVRRLGEGRTAQRLIRTRRQQLVSMLAVEDAMEGVRATLREVRVSSATPTRASTPTSTTSTSGACTSPASATSSPTRTRAARAAR